MPKDYIDKYLKEVREIIRNLDRDSIVRSIKILSNLRKSQGRLFILGVGGSAANASHAVNDFRKIAKIETYSPVDNVAELTAWANDSGFETVFINWLKISKLKKEDVIMVLSVGGGSETTSKNLVLAMQYAKSVEAKIVSVVSRKGGEALKLSDACILIPVISDERITPHAESWQSLLLHLIVNQISG